MATYHVQTDKGTFEVEVADPASGQQTPGVDPSASFPELSNVWNNPDRSVPGKLWDSLAVGEQMSKRGLESLSGMVPNPEPTGNMPMDLIRGTPKVVADTFAQGAPGFVSRASLVTAGAAKGLKAAAPIAGAIGQGIASQAESLTGAKPGAVSAAFNDAGLMFAKGKKAAQPLYEAAKAEIGEGASIFHGMYKPEQIVDAAKEYLSKGGKLEPTEALTFRKALDSLMKSGRYVKDELLAMRGVADEAAKASPSIAAADPLYQRGMYAESLRNLMPQNKYGGTSAFKLGIGTALSNLPGGKLLAALLSPAAAGTAATVGGVATRTLGPVITNPAAAATLHPLLAAYAAQKYGRQP